MTELFRVCGIAVVCCAGALLLSARERELSTLISVVVYLSVAAYAVTRLGELLSGVRSFLYARDLPLDTGLLLRGGGVALTAAIASSVCENVGNKNAARAIDALAVTEILLLGAPTLYDMLGKLLKIFGDG